MQSISCENILWFRDNPNRSLEEDLNWAYSRFRTKFHKEPTVVHVPSIPWVIDDFESVVELPITVQVNRDLQPRYFQVT